MTDWMPFGGVLATGTFVVLHLLLRASETRSPGDHALRQARLAYWTTVILTAATYTMYLIFDEDWLPYT